MDLFNRKKSGNSARRDDIEKGGKKIKVSGVKEALWIAGELEFSSEGDEQELDISNEGSEDVSIGEGDESKDLKFPLDEVDSVIAFGGRGIRHMDSSDDGEGVDVDDDGHDNDDTILEGPLMTDQDNTEIKMNEFRRKIQDIERKLCEIKTGEDVRNDYTSADTPTQALLDKAAENERIKEDLQSELAGLKQGLAELDNERYRTPIKDAYSRESAFYPRSSSHILTDRNEGNGRSCMNDMSAIERDLPRITNADDRYSAQNDMFRPRGLDGGSPLPGYDWRPPQIMRGVQPSSIAARMDGRSTSSKWASSESAPGDGRGRYDYNSNHIGPYLRGHGQGYDPVRVGSPREAADPDEVLDKAAFFGNLIRKEDIRLHKIKGLEKQLTDLFTGKRINRQTAPKLQSTPPGTEEEEQPDGLPYLNRSRIVRADSIEMDEEIKEINTEIAPLRSAQDELTAIKKLIKENPRVKQSKAVYGKSWKKFKYQLFTNIKNGDLRDFQAKVVVLDLEQSEQHNILNIKQGNRFGPLHLAIVCDKTEIVDFLIKHSGAKLTSQPLKLKGEEGEEEFTLTPLQLALYEGNHNIIKCIVESFPREIEKQENINKKIVIKSYMGHPYEELPLAATMWSCMKHENLDDVGDILQYLIQNGAKMDKKTEKEGNTLLHLIVLRALENMDDLKKFKTILDIFVPAANLWAKKVNERKVIIKGNPVRHLMSITNNNGFTPLVLAAKVESPIYQALAQWEDVMTFQYLKVQSFTPETYYCIKDVVSIGEDGGYRDKSVMHVLAHSQIDVCQRTWTTDIVDTEPLKTLIKKKWQFYRWLFYGWGVFHIVYMIVFTYFSLQDLSVNSPRINASDSLETNISLTKMHDANDLGNPYFFLFLIVPILYIIFEIWDFLIMLPSLELHYTITGNFMYRLITCAFTVFSITWFCLHMVGDVNQDILLAVSLLFGWIFCIFFTRSISFPSKDSQIGAFPIMVERMLLHDLIPFLLISFFIIISFSVAIQATLLFAVPQDDADMSFRHTFYQMLKYFAGLDDPMSEELSREQQFAKALLVIYGIIIAVLLVNMLIAAMNKSYDIIRETHCNLVARQRLAILLLLERRLLCVRSIPQRNHHIEYLKGLPWITITHKSVVDQLMNRRLPKRKSKQS